MNLNCAILHADPEIAGRLEEYIDKVPFLSLHGKYGNPLEALKDYYETKVEVYFVGIYPVEEGEINGMDFCRLLSSSTRVIFITDTDKYAAECFRLDALDYLMDGLNFSTFSSLSARRHAGSLCKMQVRPTPSTGKVWKRLRR